MKITAIKQQVKSPDRYSVFIDGTFRFGLSEAAFVASGLHSGLELSEEQLAEYLDVSRADKGYGRALDLISRRQRSEWEIREYLKRKEYEQEFIDQIVERLSNRGYLNDEMFARMWVENRRVLKPTSRRKLVLELKQKRIPVDVIDKILNEDREEVDEREVLRQLVQKKRSKYPDQTKLMQYLARQGYGYDDIRSVLAEDPDAE